MTSPRTETSRTVLVIGGGTAGCALAVLLRTSGLNVDMVEAKADWNVYGSGITLQGNALRVLREIGVWEQVRERGYSTDGVSLTTPDGTVLFTQQDAHTGGDDLPATLGMQRPALQEILIDAVRASGTGVRLGLTVEELTQRQDGVQVCSATAAPPATTWWPRRTASAPAPGP